VEDIMATLETKGFVQHMNYFFFQGLCVQIGPSPNNTELFTLPLSDTDSPAVRDAKATIISGLATALAGRLVVTVTHEEGSALIRQVFLSGTTL
jgi:hypothetical protein